MASSDVKYRVKVPLDPLSPPSEHKLVIWETDSGSFALTSSNFAGGGDATGVVVGEVIGLEPQGTPQYGVFSQVKDGTSTVLSGSDSFIAAGIDGNDGTIRTLDFVFSTGSGEDELSMVATAVPTRIQARDELDPEQTNYTYPGYSPVGNAIEYLIVTRSDNVTVGQKPEFIQISQNNNQAPYIGSSSYATDVMNCISGSYNYLKIEHVAHTLNATRMQQCTYYFGWYRNNTSKAATDLRCSVIENMRTPNNQLIIDPARTTGSFTETGGNFNLSLYHFNVDYVQHTFKYTLI